jgi:hypothetical protein
MTASRHRRPARTGGHPPRRAPVSKCAPCYRSPAPHVNARFRRPVRLHTERPNWMFCKSKHYRPSAILMHQSRRYARRS